MDRKTRDARPWSGATRSGRLVLWLGLLSGLAACGTVDWTATAGRWVQSVCEEGAYSCDDPQPTDGLDARVRR